MIKKPMGLFLFLIGLFTLLIPQWRIFYNDWNQSQQIMIYEKNLTLYDFSEKVESIEAYNESLVNQVRDLADPFENYHVVKTEITPFIEDEVMAYIEIPKIGETLPIYMGASTAHLVKGVAVIESTSLPFGGINTHSVLAGHRGYGYANFFRHLDDLVEGDYFYIHIFGETLKYTIFEKEIISPNETEKLNIIPDQDIITLLTCHPYLSNANRLLVKGVRTEVILDKGDFGNTQGTNIHHDVELDQKEIKENTYSYFNDTYIRYRLPNRIIVTLGTALIIFNIVTILRLLFKSKKR